MKKITLILMSLLLTLGAVAQDYSTRYSSSETNTNGDRFIKNIHLTGEKSGTNNVWNTSFTVGDGDEAKKMFYYKTDVIFEVVAGETLEAVFDYGGSWMHAYVYIDDNGNNGFDATWNNQYSFGGDLKTFSFYYDDGEVFGYNSAGTYISGDARSTVTCPSFAAPNNPGTYRMRFKIDWNSIDPKGDEKIKANGGTIVDVMLKVVEPTPLVENGKLYRIKNRCTNLGVEGVSTNVRDGNGAYLGSTYIKLKNVLNSLNQVTTFEANIRDIHCATTSKADAGCIWMFEGSDSDGWAIKNMNNGMYIDDQRGDAALGEHADYYVKFVEGIENAARFTISETGNYVTFYDPDYSTGTDNYLHASGAGLQIWNASSTASHWTIEPATELEVNLNEYTNNNDREGKNNGFYASLYLPFDVTFDPSVISVNTVTVQGTSAILNPQENLPANRGVILKGNSRTYTFGIPGTVSESLSDNELGGTNVDLTLDGSNSTKYFVLGKDDYGVLGLRTPSSSVAKIPANRAYLPAPTGGSVNALRFDLGETTAIENVVTEKENAPIYDLTGRRVLNTVKGGIYIQNGKKFIVK